MAGKKLDPKDIVKKYNDIKASTGGANFDKLVSGDNVRRLLTFTNGKTGNEELFVEYPQHFFNKASHVCLGSDICPVCKTQAYLEQQNGKSELTDKLKMKRRFVFNDMLENGEMKIVETGSACCKSILAIFANDDYGNIADAKEGRFVTITKSGAGLDTEYSVLPKPRISPLPAKLPKQPVDLAAWLEAKRQTEDELIADVETAFNIDYHADVLATLGKSDYNEPEKEEVDFESMNINQLKKLATKVLKENKKLKLDMVKAKKPEIIAFLNKNWNCEDDLPF